jgi:hypothetical protein
MRIPNGLRRAINVTIDWLHILNELLSSKHQQFINRHRTFGLACWGAWLCSIGYFVFADPSQKCLFPPIWWGAAFCFVAGSLVAMSYGIALWASSTVDVIRWLRDDGPRLKFVMHVAAAAWAATEPEEERGALLTLLMPEFDGRPVEERHAILARVAGTVRHQHELALNEIINSL